MQLTPHPPKKDRSLRVSVEPSLHDQLKRLAEQANLSVAEVARQLIEDALRRVNP
jgi:predicted HicB family RNase H-like nuclease